MLDNVFSLKGKAKGTSGKGTRGKDLPSASQTTPMKMLQTQCLLHTKLGDVGHRDPSSLLLM